MATDLPFNVIPFTNKSGSLSFRVTGSWNSERIRKNFPNRASADAVCNAKNAEALRAQSALPRQLIQTRLKEEDVHAAEAGIDRIMGRWPLSKVIDAGILALESHPAPRALGPLAEEWLQLVKSEASARWYSDLKNRVGAFVGAHRNLMTNELDRATVRRWLDELPLAQQSKANMRNAVHRFGNWLVERGHLRDNPAAGIRITRRYSGAQQGDRPLPSIFTPMQCKALLRACELGACRRLLGWMATCLFTGMRPDSEAPRATWAELNLKTEEWSVMGRKRGAKPRVIKLQPAAVAWMKVVERDSMEKPAMYSRRAKERAIELANDWLTNHHPTESPIIWDGDITRHTFASYRSPQVPVHELAAEMGNSPGTIYAHYRHPRPSADVITFWALRPNA